MTTLTPDERARLAEIRARQHTWRDVPATTPSGQSARNLAFRFHRADIPFLLEIIDRLTAAAPSAPGTPPPPPSA